VDAVELSSTIWGRNMGLFHGRKKQGKMRLVLKRAERDLREE
jgi:hypothetical protein